MDHSAGCSHALRGSIVIDPVCGMKVDPAKTPHRHSHRRPRLCLLLGRLPQQIHRRSGKISAQDAARPSWRQRRQARSTPARCIRKSGRSDRAPARSAAWRSSRSSVSGRSGPSDELIDMTRRFWIGAVLAVPVVILEMGGAFSRPQSSSLHCRRKYRCGFNFCWRRRWCCGPAGRSSCAAGHRSATARSTCSA